MSSRFPAVRAKLLLPLDVEIDGQMETVSVVERHIWASRCGCSFDCLLPKRQPAWTGCRLQSRGLCAGDGYLGPLVDPHGKAGRAVDDISAAPILTMTYYGGEKVVDHYNIMGPVKAALEGAMRALAVELQPGSALTRSLRGRFKPVPGPASRILTS